MSGPGRRGRAIRDERACDLRRPRTVEHERAATARRAWRRRQAILRTKLGWGEPGGQRDVPRLPGDAGRMGRRRDRHCRIDRAALAMAGIAGRSGRIGRRRGEAGAKRRAVEGRMGRSRRKAGRKHRQRIGDRKPGSEQGAAQMREDGRAGRHEAQMPPLNRLRQAARRRRLGYRRVPRHPGRSEDPGPIPELFRIGPRIGAASRLVRGDPPKFRGWFLPCFGPGKQSHAASGCFFKRTIRLTKRIIAARFSLVDWRFSPAGRGDLSEQLAPRHQTLKRHDRVVGSASRRRHMTDATQTPRTASLPAMARCRR